MFGEWSKYKPESEPLDKINLEHSIIPFLILGAGCFVALIVFLLEIIFGEKRHQAQQAITNEKEKMYVNAD